MRVRNIAVAGLLATTLLGASALPQFVATPGFAEEASDTNANSSQGSASNANVRDDASATETSLGALIEGTAEKNEVVYASMTATGAVKNLYVVNELFSTVPAMIKDFGAYQEVLNLTDEASLAQEPDSVVCVVEDESFVYQGTLASTELPWDIKITYELDGAAIAPEELAGKSGELKLLIETNQNTSVSQDYFDNYLLQITCTLPIEHATKIASEEGQVALAGSNTTVVFSAMPGKSGSYELAAQVKDFEMEGISIAAIPFSMAIDAPDSDALVAQFDALIEGAGRLNEGADGLSDGATALDGGVQAFGQGATQLKDGADELSTGVAAYVAGVGQVNQGLAQAAAGSNAFAAKLAELSQASAGIVSSIEASTTQIQTLVAQIQSSTLPDDQKAALIQQIQGLSTQLSGLKDYAAGVGALSEGYAPLDSSLTRLSTGLSDLSQQGSSLTQGASELGTGADELANSTGSLAQGSSQLATGASELAQGTTQLEEESKLIPDKVRTQIDELMADYDKSDFTPTSFVDARNTNVKLVQFVMATEAIHLPDPEPEEAPEEDETLLSRFFALFS